VGAVARCGGEAALVRGREDGFSARLELARRRFTRSTVAIATAAAGLVLTLGGFIFYNTNVLNTYSSSSETTQRRVEYERRFRQYETIPQARRTAVDLRVEIYPEQRAVSIRGTYQLVNLGAVAIDSIHLTTNPQIEIGEIAFDRAARSVVADENLGYRIYALAKPLLPGDSVRLSFDARFCATRLPQLRSGAVRDSEWHPLSARPAPRHRLSAAA
jgi:hypothetical protein